MKFALIVKGEEYRLTEHRVTDTELANHKRHGWRVVKQWDQKPTATAVKATIYNDAQQEART